MTQFLDLINLNELETRATAWEVFFTVCISFGLGLLISFTYIKTFKGQYYSQSFVQTLVIVSVVISIVIVVIGSNIARAFSLAGALSIIRFRSAIRDPRDVGFIFFAMAAGLACGAGLFIPGVVFAVILCAFIYLLNFFNYGYKKMIHKNLKITIPENINYEGLFDDLFNDYLEESTFLGVRSTSLGTMFELSYSIRTRKGISEKDFLDEIRARNGNLNVSIQLAQQEVY